MGFREIGMGRRRGSAAIVLATALLAALALSACGGGGSSSGSSSGGGESSSGGTITVGADVPLTGPLAENGQRLKKAYEFEVDKVNAAGGINGSQVKLVAEDDQGDPATATTVVKKLIATEGAEAILGTYGSDPGLAGSQVAEQYEIPNVQPFASAPEMVERGYKFLFNTYPLASQEEEVFTSYLNEEVKPKTAALVYLNNPYAIAGGEVDAEKLEAAGTKIVLQEEIETAQSDYSSVISKIAEAKPEAVLFIVYPPDELVLMKELKQFNVDPNLVYMNAASGFEPQILEALGETADWVVGTPEWYTGAPLPQATKTMAEYEKAFHQAASIETFKGIQAAEILFHAMEEAGGAEGEALRESLAATDFSPLGEHVTFGSDGQINGSVLIAQLQGLKGVALSPADKKQGTLKPFPAWDER
jgi:branched-chain amino acid transport system substrate-binding protein